MSDEQFIKICLESRSMKQAFLSIASNPKSGAEYRKFKERAEKLNCFKPNQSGKGVPCETARLPYEHFAKKNVCGHKLKSVILRDNLLEYRCQECGLDDLWNGKKLSLHLDHIDGNNTNHDLSNLRFLCPNCHTQTETYCGKNKTGRNLSDEDYLTIIPEVYNVAECMRKLGKRPQKHHYEKIEKLLQENDISFKQ
jgi:5-methylcytosine-specific restriction endonuclease McrA